MNSTVPPSPDANQMSSISAVDWKSYYNKEHEITRFVPECDPTEKWRLTFVQSLLPRSPLDRILDAGCGDGYQCRELARHCRYIVGCDIALPRLQFAREYSIGLPLCAADLTRPPFQVKSFDLVTLVEVLEHMTEPLVVLRALARLSRRYLLVAVPYKQNLERVMCPHCLNTYMLDGHLHRFDEATLRAMLEEAGLRVVRIERFFLPGTWEMAGAFRWLPYFAMKIVRRLLQKGGFVAPDNALFIGALCEVE